MTFWHASHTNSDAACRLSASVQLLVASYKNVSGFMSDLGRAVGALTSPLASPSLNRQGSSNSCAGEMQRQWSCSSVQEGACANTP